MGCVRLFLYSKIRIVEEGAIELIVEKYNHKNEKRHSLHIVVTHMAQCIGYCVVYLQRVIQLVSVRNIRISEIIEAHICGARK